MIDSKREKLSLLQQSTFGAGVQAQHGGRGQRGVRKTSRPLEPSLPLYLVLRSARARGKWSLKRRSTEAAVAATLGTLSERHAIEIFEFANGGDQVHLLLRAESREGFQAFLRAFAGLVARQVTGARKGKPAGRFWDALTYSRVLNWGPEFDVLRSLVAAADVDALAQLSAPSPVARRELGSSRKPRAPRLASAASGESVGRP
jgi:hypothetical protein